ISRRPRRRAEHLLRRQYYGCDGGRSGVALWPHDGSLAGTLGGLGSRRRISTLECPFVGEIACSPFCPALSVVRRQFSWRTRRTLQRLAQSARETGSSGTRVAKSAAKITGFAPPHHVRNSQFAAILLRTRDWHRKPLFLETNPLFRTDSQAAANTMIEHRQYALA